VKGCLCRYKINASSRKSGFAWFPLSGSHIAAVEAEQLSPAYYMFLYVVKNVHAHDVKMIEVSGGYCPLPRQHQARDKYNSLYVMTCSLCTSNFVIKYNHVL